MKYLSWLVVLGALVACESSGGSALQQQGPVDASIVDAAVDGEAPDAAVDMLADAAPPDLGPPPTYETCFADQLTAVRPDYTQYNPVLGHHCHGTNHQDIDGIERVVFLGDSVTTGTPPSLLTEFYRALMANELTMRFGDDLIVENCSKFGARTDDFFRMDSQLGRCFPDGGSDLTTLTVFTIGGNDFFAWAEDALTTPQAVAAANQAADLLDEAVAWMVDPARFPNGNYVIFANPYEYTDATGDLASCELAERIGLRGNWLVGADAVITIAERFMQTAVKYQVDMIFTLEAFCGHGFRADDPEGPCYRGPGTETWFDFTCIHPTPTGHAAIAEMFMAVVDQ
jgi:lysophospholipase L1-like esterase